MAPYRALVGLPGGDEAEFVILRAFVPLDEDDTRKELAAFMVGRSDAAHYGELVVYRPPSSNFDGPALAEERIRNDDDVASLQTLLSQRGSTVLFGELLLVPIENSILYVRPLYVQAEGDTTVPELERVIVAVGEDVVIARSLQEALEELTDADLSELFTGLVVDSSTQNASSGGLGEVGEPADEDPLSLVTVPDDVAGLLVEIDRLQRASASALASDPADWEEFGRLQAQIQGLVSLLSNEAA
jgi:uncharacterized membrane protein (UPF0182 family)